MAAWLDVLRIELLLLIAFLVGTLSVFFAIASQSYLPDILSTEDLTEGNARLHTGWGISEIGGPGLAGWLTQTFSAPIAIMVDGVSYIVSAVLLVGVRVSERSNARSLEGSQPNFRRELMVASVIAGAGFFLTGLTIPIYDVNQFSLRQAVTPLHLQGRVSATMRTLIRGLVPIGALLGGLLAERIGLRGVMIVSALGGPAAFLAIWFSPVRVLPTPPARMDT